jgi:hypothetical protein
MLERDLERLLAWVRDRVPVPMFNVVVEGARGTVPTEFSTFACLYPDPPACRVYALAHVALEPHDVRRRIAAFRLPDDAEPRHRACMQATSPRIAPGSSWDEVAELARREGIPIGFLALGETVSGGHPRALLAMIAGVSPTMFAERLKLAASS